MREELLNEFFRPENVDMPLNCKTLATPLLTMYAIFRPVLLVLLKQLRELSVAAFVVVVVDGRFCVVCTTVRDFVRWLIRCSNPSITSVLRESNTEEDLEVEDLEVDLEVDREVELEAVHGAAAEVGYSTLGLSPQYMSRYHLISPSMQILVVVATSQRHNINTNTNTSNNIIFTNFYRAYHQF